MAHKFSIKTVIEHYAERPIPERGTGWTPILCPMHDEARPSAAYNEAKGTLSCMGCMFYGDALDIIEAKEGVTDFKEQVKIAEAITGETLDGSAGVQFAPARRLPRRITDGAAIVRPAAGPIAAAPRVKKRRRI